MSVASKLLETLKCLGHKRTETAEPEHSIPTVEFDAARVTDAIKDDIWKNILLLELDRACVDRVYQAAVRSISAGRDLRELHDTLMQLNIGGMTKRRAAEIARFLNNSATALMYRQREEAIRIKQARWLYSGASCEIDPKKPTGQDASHRAANGKLFDVSKGMLLNGNWTLPGAEPGCRCVSKSIVPGFS